MMLVPKPGHKSSILKDGDNMVGSKCWQVTAVGDGGDVLAIPILILISIVNGILHTLNDCSDIV